MRHGLLPSQRLLLVAFFFVLCFATIHTSVATTFQLFTTTRGTIMYAGISARRARQKKKGYAPGALHVEEDEALAGDRRL
jgi:hypothetical protein